MLLNRRFFAIILLGLAIVSVGYLASNATGKSIVPLNLFVGQQALAELNNSGQSLILTENGLDWYVQNIRIGTFNGEFYDSNLNLIDLNFIPVQSSDNITFIASDLLGNNYTAWFITSEVGGFKYGVKFDGISITNRTVKFRWDRNPEVTYTIGDKKVLASHPSLSDPVAFYYHDVPEEYNLQIDETGANVTISQLQSWVIDPALGQTDDGFNTAWEQTATDLAVTTTCRLYMSGNNSIGDRPTLYGSFDHPEDNVAMEVRKPMRVLLDTNVGVVGNQGICRFQAYNDSTTRNANTQIFDESFTVNTVNASRVIDWRNFTFTGEASWTVTATANDGVGGSVTTTGNPTYGIAPYVRIQFVDKHPVNFYERITAVIVYGTLGRGTGSGDFTTIRWHLRDSSIDTAITNDNSTTSRADVSFILSDFLQNPVRRNTNRTTINFTTPQGWTGEVFNHGRLSGGSINSTLGFNLTDKVICNAFETRGVSIPRYNLGENISLAGQILSARGTQWVNATGGRDSWYLNITAANTVQNSSAIRFDLNTSAGWLNGTRIPLHAIAGSNISGVQYSANLTGWSGTQTFNNNTCMYNAFNVTRVMNVSTSVSEVNNSILINRTQNTFGIQKVYNKGQWLNITFIAYNARGERITNTNDATYLFFNATIINSTGTPEVSQILTRPNADGFITFFIQSRATESAAATVEGIAKFLQANMSNNTANSSLGSLAASTLLFVDSHVQKTNPLLKDSIDGDETETFFYDIYQGAVVNHWAHITAADGANITQPYTLYIYNTSTLRGSTFFNRQTDTDGWSASATSYPSRHPSGQWQFEVIANDTFGNMGVDNETVTFDFGIAPDPGKIDCPEEKLVGDTVYCYIGLYFLNGTSRTGAVINFTVTANTSTAYEFAGFGSEYPNDGQGTYQVNFTPTRPDVYRIYINTSTDIGLGTAVYKYTTGVTIRRSYLNTSEQDKLGTGSGGGLTTDQNRTLYAVYAYITTHLTNQTQFNSTRDIIISYNDKINQSTNSTIPNLINDVASQVWNFGTRTLTRISQTIITKE